MAQRKGLPSPRPADVGSGQMRDALPILERRINELRAFEIASVQNVSDPRIGALRHKIDDLLIAIFGNDTVEYNRYRVFYLVDLPEVVGYESYSGHEVQAELRKGIEAAISKLETIRDLFNEKLEDLGESPTRKARRAFDESPIHPELQKAVGKLFADGHYANAVEDACKVLEMFVKVRSGKHDLSGTDLMLTVFSPKSPVLRFNELATDTDRSEQQGMMFLYAGSMLALRNPRAHGIVADEPEKALEILTFVSFLIKSLDLTVRV
jgi:uncharacterized protein (TIGR02391 family)